MTELRPADGSILHRYYSQQYTHNTTGLAFDGANIWAALYNFNEVVKF